MKQEHDYSGALEAFEKIAEMAISYAGSFSNIEEYYDVQDMVEEIRAALEAQQWNFDMDAAPRDGSAVLLYGSIADHPEELVSFNNDRRVTGYWDSVDSAWCATVSTWLGAFIDAVAWQPLPKPPQDGGDDA